MSIAWSDLLAAFAIYLIFEGLLPWLNPSGFKRYLAQLLTIEERMLRIGGAAMVLIGLGVLLWVR